MNEISFQNKLRVARAEKRISQGELAEMVGVSRQTISSIENNQFCPSAKLALLLCIALDKKFEELFFFFFYNAISQCILVILFISFYLHIHSS